MAKKNPSKKNQTLVASVCLYGVHAIGFAYYAATPTNNFAAQGGWGPEHRPNGNIDNLTSAVFLAVHDLRDLGVVEGLVRIFEPGGLRYADTDISNPGYFGDLNWKACG
jgi:hypothetical protein